VDTGQDQLEEVEASPLRYDEARHEYIDATTGEVLPHITGMLKATGWVDDTWFTEESSRRGTEVHRLTLDYDLDAIDVEQCVSEFRGYLLGYDKAIRVVRPTWAHLEEPFIHPRLRFGGRPDRAGDVYKLRSVGEIKTAKYAKSHQVQMALQAILVASKLHITPEAIQRFVFYLEPNGKWKLEHLTDGAAFAEARRVIRKCCAL
jgi:hypothetical protein